MAKLAVILAALLWLAAAQPCAALTSATFATASPFPVPTEWLQAGKGCTVSGGGPCTSSATVAAWADQSGNGNNAAKCTAGPTYGTSVINGLPALYFTSSSSQCLTDSYSGAVGTVIAVYYTTTENTNLSNTFQEVIAGAPQASVAITAYDFQSDEGASTVGSVGHYHVRLFSFGTTHNSSNYSWFTQNSSNRFVWNIAGMTENAGVLTTYEGGTPTATVAIPSGATLYTAPSQVIGAGDYNNSHGNFYDGFIAEIMVYAKPLTSQQYGAAVGYLKTKYALNPVGAYLMMSVNQNPGAYDANAMHILQGDGSNFKYTLPANYVPSILSGQSTVVDLAPVPLRNNNGALVKYHGRYWVIDSRCPYGNSISWPCHYVDILSSTDFANWTLSGTLNCDAVLDGVSSTRGCFNDGWFIDPVSGSVNALYNASNTAESFTGSVEYYTPMTLNANGSFSAGTTTAITGSSFPSAWYTSAIQYIGGTYYLFLSETADASHYLYWASSTSPFSGYAGITHLAVSGTSL
jgi:hypothetical protein